jgi:predicted nucleic acid-binding protein
LSYLIDTNILLRLEDDDDPRHEQCASAVDLLRNSGAAVFICAQVLAEFWVVLTRPRDVNGWGLEFNEAVEQMADVRESFPCLPEPPDIADRWQWTVFGSRAMGKPAYDAKLAALMMAHGVKHIVTLNPGDFTRYYPDVVAVTPKDILGIAPPP